MDNRQVVLFGEAEKGCFGTAYYLQSLPQLADYLGNPPPDSEGLIYAVQVIMYERNLIFFRVEEEGYSYHDYFHGLKLLEKNGKELNLSAICLPGVGDGEIMEAVGSVCGTYSSLIIMNEPDLYDYLTDQQAI
jgi:hypothetical protein